MKVIAKALGYYGKRIKEGEVFVLKSEKDFSEKWMAIVGEDGKAVKPAKASKKAKEEVKAVEADDSDVL
jgi:hypothetical protein